MHRRNLLQLASAFLLAPTLTAQAGWKRRRCRPRSTISCCKVDSLSLATSPLAFRGFKGRVTSQYDSGRSSVLLWDANLPNNGYGDLNLELGLARRGLPCSLRFLAFEAGLAKVPGLQPGRHIVYSSPRIRIQEFTASGGVRLAITSTIWRVNPPLQGTIAPPQGNIVPGGNSKIRGLVQLSYAPGAYIETPTGWVNPKTIDADWRLTTGFGDIGAERWTYGYPFALSVVMSTLNIVSPNRIAFVESSQWDILQAGFGGFGPNVENRFSHRVYTHLNRGQTGELNNIFNDNLSEIGSYKIAYYE